MDSHAAQSSSATPREVGGDDFAGRGRASLALHAAAIFASAFLIFLVQPMVGKRILPWFGGVPAVWTLCLAFYQTALFLGYAYAHLLIRFVPPPLQLAIHAVAVASALVALPVLPDAAPDLAGGADPTRAVLTILASNVAAPFLVLASTGPLVQAWFARAHPTRSPYALYAVSNVGSFLALFAYPFLLEPRMPLSSTGALWGYGFVLTGALVLACARPRATRSTTPAEPGDGPATLGTPPDPVAPISPRQALFWLLLSGTAVVLLMAVTNKLCLDVASVPFLWIVPLATYLATFILAFASERTYRRPWFVTAALASFVWTRAVESNNALIVYQVLAYSALLFTVCMVLHGELYRIRPAARSLTAFYLCVSAGGALAGVLVGIGAPRVFDDYYELPVGLVATALLVLAVCWLDPSSLLGSARPRWRRGTALLAVIAGSALLLWQETRPSIVVLHKERSFFGVLTVNLYEEGDSRQRLLMNGTTVHGVQFLGRSERRLPTAYFGRATGLGLALTSRESSGASRIGVIGLGVGTLAAYGREGDLMRFYEIDPVVVEIAGPGGYFSFVEDSKAEVEMVLGDARLSIEAEQQRGERQDFDVLVLDAFSSDSIPLHLMTREAFARYFDALAEDGLMAVHVSNRHFQLMSLVSRLAAEFGAHSLQIKTRPAPQYQSGLTDWVIIARDSDQLTRLQIRMGRRLRSLELPADSILLRRGSEMNLEAFPLWTDDYSDLFRVIRWN